MNKLGIICALRSEARCFRSGTLPAQQAIELDEKTLLILSGMGRERARQAAEALVEAGADCLAGVGVAGALAPGLRPGDLMVATEVIEAGRKFTVSADLTASVIKWLSRKNFSADSSSAIMGWLSRNRFSADLSPAVMKWLSQNNFSFENGPLACAAAPVATIEAKRRLFAQTGAIAVDMESAGVLDAAQRNGLPAFVLRVIIDAAHVALPDAVLRRVDEFGDIDAPGLALDLARSPGQIPAVVRLACAARRAGGTMKKVSLRDSMFYWIPACAGMTNEKRG